MTEETNNGERAPERSDKTAKLIFTAVALVIGVAVYMFLQAGGDEILDSWPADLDAAQARARQADRRVLAVFVSNPPNADCVFVASKTLAKAQNRKAIEAGNYTRVKVVVNDLEGPRALKYKLTVLPTIIVFGPDGGEVLRAEGKIGEVPFMEFMEQVKNKP